VHRFLAAYLQGVSDETASFVLREGEEQEMERARVHASGICGIEAEMDLVTTRQAPMGRVNTAQPIPSQHEYRLHHPWVC